MVKNKIIRKVTELTDWVSSLAYSHKKDGSLRICLDPRFSNTDHIHEKLKHKQDMQKMYHDRTAYNGFYAFVL